MSDEVSKDIWSKQFYKALEAVGNLTEQERFKLGQMLIALSDVKGKSLSLKREIPPYNPRPLRDENNTVNGIGQGYQPIKVSSDEILQSPPKKP